MLVQNKIMQGKKAGSQIDFFIFQIELFTNIVSVIGDRTGGHIQQFRDFLGDFACLNQIGDPNFRGRQIKIIRSQLFGKG